MFKTISVGRKCGSCTKCCEGFLIGEAFGVKFGYGMTCSFKNKSGCLIQETKPTVCKEFECEWKTSSYIPEWLKPDKSNIILVRKRLGDFLFLRVVSLKEIDQKIYDWAAEFNQIYKNCNIIIPYKTGFKVYSQYSEFIDIFKKENIIFE